MLDKLFRTLTLDYGADINRRFWNFRMTPLFLLVGLGLSAILLLGVQSVNAKTASLKQSTVLSNKDVCFSAKQNSDDPVNYLNCLYHKNLQVHHEIDAAFQQLVKTPDGTPNPWSGKSFKDFSQFFREWLNFIPNESNGLKYIRKFS
jgi:hypothetical protein